MPLPASTLRRTGRRVLVPAALLLASAITLAACGAAAKVPPPLSRAEMQATLAADPISTTPIPGLSTSPGGSGATPKAVVDLIHQAGTVLPGKADQALSIYDGQLAKLRGTPVVANLWGDWCAPCQKEIPVFQRVAMAYRGQVAFLGVGTESKRSYLEKYLATQKWLPYPSVLDDDGDVLATTHVKSVPQTIFYSRTGKRFVHIGPYESVADLETDIKRYTS